MPAESTVSRAPSSYSQSQETGKAIDPGYTALQASVTMLLITTALMLEARPLVRRLGLRPVSSGTVTVYEGGSTILVVTGTGSVRAAAATGWAMARFPDIRQAMNVGFAGAAPEVAELHSWSLINRIRDQVTGHLLLPDILWKHPFPERPLLTVPRVVRETMDWAGLVDMEGAGFFEAARQFLGPDQIALLKWVSDPLTGRIDPTETEAAFETGLEGVVEFSRNWPGPQRTAPEPGTVALIEEINGRVRLTRTQAEFLEKWVSGFLARGGNPERIRKALPDSIPRIKEANKRVFQELKDVLKS